MRGAAVVLGAGVSGLVAAAYLARAGAKVVVLEKEAAPGGICANRIPVGDFAVPAGPETLVALDPQIVKDLRLTKLGLRFAVRDLPLVCLRSDGSRLFLPRDVHDACRSIAPLSARDAERYGEFRHELFAFGRAMRALWWDDGALVREPAELARLRLAASASWIESVFESEALRAAFGFDALAAGWSPSAAGSAMVLAWRAAQEMCGLQGAAAMARGGPATLVDALVKAAQTAGVEFRTGAEAVRLMVQGEMVTGVVLAGGEPVPAQAVLSSLPRRKTLLEFLPPGYAGFAAARRLERAMEVGEGKLVLGLKAVPFAFKEPGRFVVAERLDSLVTAHAEARAGKLPSELALEAVSLETGDELLLSILIRPLPVNPPGGWKEMVARLVPAVLHTLEHLAPGVTAQVSAIGFVPPIGCDPVDPDRMLASWPSRIVTPVRGLFVCGEAAEPVPAVSGRGARIAAGLAIQHLKEARS